MKKFITLIAAGAAVIVAVVLVRTATFTSSQVEVEPVALIDVDADEAAQHLATALTFRTISHQDPADFKAAPFEAFRRFLASTYPRMHGALSLEVVNDYSLLYTWEGSDPALAPVILMAHMDVVPVDPATLGDWIQPPYDGVVEGGYIWGRGAIDNKGGLMGIVEAVEHLLEGGFAPARTVYIAFGHDEEIGGHDGAKVMAGMLQQRGAEPVFVLDEGGYIAHDIITGVDPPVAMLGVAEKGYFTVELAVRTDGGHSSRPPDHTGLGILSRAAVRLEENQFAASIKSPVREQLATLGPYMPFARKMVLANLWLFSGRVKAQFLTEPATAASIRTTTAITMAAGSSKENILPVVATMIVNFRILPGETSDDVLAHIERVIDDPQVTVTTLGGINEPSPLSDLDGEVYRTIARSIRQVFPGVVVAPNLLLGATDSYHFVPLTDNIYRFYPVNLGPGDAQRVHGTNERMGSENFVQVIQFFARLLETSTAG
ncbi:MAG: M20/M25/M40 family metallo-hydrolase [Candidatus Marinimicrobia bacterium]|nr:M20/M25/M40 family metallo-hydrolase [Candidatus Neomarinimicrobiota bacterium]